jgi:hypothetical protein
MAAVDHSVHELPHPRIALDPGGDYYVFPEFGFAFPVTNGHYSVHLDKGVFLQSQVAP